MKLRVVRKSERAFHTTAKKQHAELIRHHRERVREIKETNEHLKETHDAEAERRAELQRQEEENAERIYQEALQRHEAHIEWWEHSQSEKKRLGSFLKSISPFNFKLRDGDNSKLMGEPGDPPERPEVPQLPTVEDPVLVEIPDEPEFLHDEPMIYEAVQVDADGEHQEVETLGTTILAAPGSWVLTDEDKNAHVVPDEIFKSEYAKV